MIKFLKKYHKWISIVFTIFIILFSISGIILNHRNLLSGFDVSRKVLPSEYGYKNWNNASVRSTYKINPDSILIYGNIGVWLTDSTFSKFQDFNNGFPEGIDNRKISKIISTKNNQLLAGTHFGLFNYENSIWKKIELPVEKERISDIILKEDSVFILTRSFLLKSSDIINFEVITLPDPVNYDNKIGLFKTLWVIHSGEIYGEVGKLIVDFIALILIILTISGLILFFNKFILKKTKLKNKRTRIKHSNKFWLKWHNKIGWTTIIFLLITSSTGIFLRPPFLIPIANEKVSKIPFSELDTDNAWFDKLRRINYNSETNTFLVSTSEGFYYSGDNFKTELKPVRFQPPVSIMGLNVFEEISENKYLIGSFEGLFAWEPESGFVFDIIKQQPYSGSRNDGRPIGQFLIAGFSMDYLNSPVAFDYNLGALALDGKDFISMPKELSNQPISLWNVALEIHTGRIFQSLLSDFYILIVPLTGIALLFILISGFIVWNKKYRNTTKNNKTHEK